MGASAHDPWIRYRDTSLYVVPSIHHRQIFAELVYDACWRKRFDVIAVELPPSYAEMGIVDAFLRMAPAPGFVIHPSGCTEVMEVPANDHPDCEETETRVVQKAVLYAMTPCDSIVMALRCPGLLRRRWPGWKPEVALIDAEHREIGRSRSDLPMADDYEVAVKGLAAFYARLEERLDAVRVVEVDARRERVMGSRLRGLLDEGKEVLFVCGAAHWKSLREYLDMGCPPDSPFREGSGPPERLLLAPVRPEAVWVSGWLDDIPRIVWEFETACVEGRPPESFDKHEALKIVWRETIELSLAKKRPVSPRRLFKMRRYARTLADASGRWIPALDRHLIHAAESCVGEEFAEAFKEVALRFPSEPPDGVPYARFTRAGDGGFFMMVGEEVFHLEPTPKSDPDGGGFRVPIEEPVPLTTEEKQKLEKSGNRKAFPGQQDLHNRLIDRARRLAHRTRRETITRRFSGDIGLGPSWRSSMRALSRGEKRFLHVRQAKRGPKYGSCDGTCPVAWIFDAEATNLSQHSSEHVPLRGDFEAFDDLFQWHHPERKIEANVIELRVAYSVSLTRGLIPLFDKTEKDYEKFLAWYPPERLCRTDPDKDPDLRPFRGGYEIAIACAVKYAADHLVVVALPDLRISERLLRFASDRGVRLIRVSRDDFDPRSLSRLSLYHRVPAPGPWSKPYEFCYRFIPPV